MCPFWYVGNFEIKICRKRLCIVNKSARQKRTTSVILTQFASVCYRITSTLCSLYHSYIESELHTRTRIENGELNNRRQPECIYRDSTVKCVFVVHNNLTLSYRMSIYTFGAVSLDTNVFVICLFRIICTGEEHCQSN